MHQTILDCHENHSGDTRDPNVQETQAPSEKMSPKILYMNRSSCGITFTQNNPAGNHTMFAGARNGFNARDGAQP